MPVETFSKNDFENALKAIKAEWSAKYPALTGAYVSMNKGEHCWTMTPLADRPLRVFIRSSVRGDGTSAACGEDSIRCFIVDMDNQFVGGKIQRHTTRMPQWEQRLSKLLGALFGIIALMGKCDTCGETIKPFRVSKAGPNKGRLFLTCSRDCKSKFFQFIDDSDGDTAESLGRCPEQSCGRALVQRTAGPTSTQPGRAFVCCPAGHKTAWRWLDSASKPPNAASERPGASKGQGKREPEPADRGDAWEGPDLPPNAPVETKQGVNESEAGKPVKVKSKAPPSVALAALLVEILNELDKQRHSSAVVWRRRFNEIRQG